MIDEYDLIPPKFIGREQTGIDQCYHAVFLDRADYQLDRIIPSEDFTTV